MVCRCIGCMKGVVLLSEIHPFGSHYYNPLVQACEWHGLFSRSEIEHTNLPFIDAIEQIHTRVKQQGKTLVIRDWSYLDYFGRPFTNKPFGNSMLQKVLSRRFDILEVSIIRHPVDLWISLKKLPSMKGLGLDTYLNGYLRYTEKCLLDKFFKYESLTVNPDNSLENICNALDIEFDTSYNKRWMHYDSITGAVHGKSRGSNLDRIHPLPQQSIPHDLNAAFASNRDFRRAIKLLDY